MIYSFSRDVPIENKGVFTSEEQIWPSYGLLSRDRKTPSMVKSNDHQDLPKTVEYNFSSPEKSSLSHVPGKIYSFYPIHFYI